MSLKQVLQTQKPIIEQVDRLECPFREFRDNELHIDTWGLGTTSFKQLLQTPPTKATAKSSHDSGGRPAASSQVAKSGVLYSGLWTDDQTQPLPRSVRHYLHGWIRAEDIAMDRWGADVIIFEENDQMAIADTQLCHAQVLFRSSFCRKVLSTCYLLERVDFIVEHQWELFTCVFAPEGWRAKYHIYSPGLKGGGGVQHKPTLSKNGCYLVRLFYLGAWRCVWVNDQVPVDTSGSPLLPFSPLLTYPPAKPGSTRVPAAVTADVVYLWPLLLTKALLKLAAPDMNSDEEDTENAEDEPMGHFDILHALTGGVNIRYPVTALMSSEDMWVRLSLEVPIFTWEDDEEGSTIRTKSTKKPTAKDLASVVKRSYATTYVIIKDSKHCPTYYLPGITPAHEQILIVNQIRDLPLKKPLPEPEVALWKYYRWVDWAKAHGLYAAYECPRDRYLKVNGLMKCSFAPHMLEVQSTESITMGFVQEQYLQHDAKQDDDTKSKKKKDTTKTLDQQQLSQNQQVKAELREWIQYNTFFPLLDCIQVVYYPSQFNYTSAGSSPPIRINAKVTSKVAPKHSPLYLQIDGPDVNKLRIAFSAMHPRILLNSKSPVDDYIESGHVVLEKFEWFKDTALPNQIAFLATRKYNALEIDLGPGRHFLRIWTHYRLNWHIMLISESTLLVSTRDVVQAAAVRECSWASRFLLNLQSSFLNWTKIIRSSQAIAVAADREFFSSYLPDLPWDNDVVGYDRHLLHWMFRQALQSLLTKTMNFTELKIVGPFLRKYFCDPDFGFPEKPRPQRSLREIVDLDICDCVMPEIEFMEEEVVEVQRDRGTNVGSSVEHVAVEEKPLVAPEVTEILLRAPKPPVVSQICEMATEELHCAILKEEREKMIKKHEAAIVLQAYWRGTWARKVLTSNLVFTPEVTKYMMERAFGTQETLSMLMNELFLVYPGTKTAYSVSSALSGVYGLQQHTGTTVVTPKCTWIPHFQGVFYCHTPVKVHFDVQSSIAHNTVAVYNNDTGEQLPQVYNSHITFNFAPNIHGYTVLGHGTLAQVSGTFYDAYWQLTIMSSLSGAFHHCDNDEPCREFPLPQSNKLHIDEIFLPNRRNILGGIHISVTKQEEISFRAAASSSDLQMVATLRSILPIGATEVIATCSGKGEIYWPYIRLEPSSAFRKSQSNLARELQGMTYRSQLKNLRLQKGTQRIKTQSGSKLRLHNESKAYSIEVVCPTGWPLTVDQWKRVNEVRNSNEALYGFQLSKKGKETKEKEKPGKPNSAKVTIQKPEQQLIGPQPLHGDACVELECALAAGSGAVARRDDERDQEFAQARKSWAASEDARNQRGAQIRKDFRAEFLIVPTLPQGPTISDTDSARSASTAIFDEAALFEHIEEASKDMDPIQRPSAVSESEMVEMSLEVEEESVYLVMPEQLRDKFIPLDFLPFCLKEKGEEESVLVSEVIANAAKKDRHARIEAALERMRELQIFNTEHVIGRQRNRCQMLEKLFVDATFSPEIAQVMGEKEEAIAQESLLRNLSATKKKLDAKKK